VCPPVLLKVADGGAEVEVVKTRVAYPCTCTYTYTVQGIVGRNSMDERGDCCFDGIIMVRLVHPSPIVGKKMKGTFGGTRKQKERREKHHPIPVSPRQPEICEILLPDGTHGKSDMVTSAPHPFSMSPIWWFEWKMEM